MSGPLTALIRIFFALLLLLPTRAADPTPAGRKTYRIANAWNLTAAKHVQSETEGTRTKLLTSTGAATLKRGPSPIKGPWEVEAKADTILCDFVGKKFILQGSPWVLKKNKQGQRLEEVTGEAKTTIEIGFEELTLQIKGPHKTTLPDAPATPAPDAKDASTPSTTRPPAK